MRDGVALSYLEELPHCRLLCGRGLLPSRGCRSVPGKTSPRAQPPGFIREWQPAAVPAHASRALPPFRAGPVQPRCPGTTAAPAQGASRPS